VNAPRRLSLKNGKGKLNRSLRPAKPNRSEAEEAVRTLIRWAGDDPAREGLVGTPDRVVRAYEEFFGGYESDPVEILTRTFEEIADYDEMVVLKDIRFESHCEHHILPIIGKAHIAYLPDHRVVGISKLARVVQGFARRLQIQEKLTAEIAGAIQDILKPKGVGVVVISEHSCMTMRGVKTPGTRLTTSHLIGQVRDDPRTRQEFFELVRNG